jgi:hypothetical protein
MGSGLGFRMDTGHDNNYDNNNNFHNTNNNNYDNNNNNNARDGYEDSDSSDPEDLSKDRGHASWKGSVYSRILWASIGAIVLNVSTVGSAFWLDFLTPSVGLGCRSGGLLIYWMMSYIVWIVLALAAWLSDRWSVHEASVRVETQKLKEEKRERQGQRQRQRGMRGSSHSGRMQAGEDTLSIVTGSPVNSPDNDDAYPNRSRTTTRQRPGPNRNSNLNPNSTTRSRPRLNQRALLGTLAVFFRILGKTLAVLNFSWIIIHCLFEFTGFYSRCWCTTNRQMSEWLFLDDAGIRNLDNVRERWLGLAFLNGIICALYIGFLGSWTMVRLRYSSQRE